MKLNKKISKQIRTIRNSLKWNVTIERSDTVEGYGLRSKPETKEHVIVLPPKKPEIARLSKASEFHEYIHAWLGETVHPLFGAYAFVNALDNDFGNEVIRWCLNETLDWFVDHEMHVRCPQALEHRLRTGGRSDYGGPIDQDMMKIDPVAYPITQSLLDAQRWKYLREKARNRPHFMTQMTEAFLRVEPARPTIGKAAFLFNSLLPIGGLPVKVTVVEADGMNKWMLYDSVVAAPAQNRGHQSLERPQQVLKSNSMEESAK